MDPRKNFICPASKHIINDTQRRWGAQSICEQCVYEEAIDKEEGVKQDGTEK